MLRRQKWIILAAMLVVLAATAAFTYTRPLVFESGATFLVVSPGGDDGGAALDVLERVGESSSIETETELLQSRRVMEPVVETLGLHTRLQVGQASRRPEDVFPAFLAGRTAVPGSYSIRKARSGEVTVTEVASGRKLAQGRPGSELAFSGIALTLPQDSLPDEVVLDVSSFPATVQGALGRISAAPLDREANLIELTCRGRSARAAHDLCAGVSEGYMTLRNELKRAEATAAADFLTEQVDGVAKRLEAAEDSLRDYQAANQAVALDARANSEVQQYASLQSQRDQLEAERMALDQLINRIQSGSDSGVRDVASFPTFLRTGNPVISDLLHSLVQLENQRADLAKTRTDRNPDIVAIDSRIDEIENQLGSIATNYESALQTQIGSLDRMVGRATGRMSAIPAKQVETARLSRQVELLDTMYRSLQTRLREADMARSISMPSVRVVDQATMPLGPVGKNLPLNLALGLVLGLGFGLLLAAYRERSDTRFRGRRAVESETGVPVLAMFPELKEAGPILPVSRPPRNGSPGGALPVRHSWENQMAREAFWSLVTDLQFAVRDMKNGGFRSLAVTSSTRGEGKTFSACNLAIAESSAAVRTLLIDADLRGRGVSRFFELDSHTPGLAEVLAGRTRLHDAWRPLSVEGRGELYVLPCGTSQTDRHIPLDMNQLDALVDSVESQFDLIVIDTPPLNILSDAAAIASTVDGVMVVVRAGLTDREALDLTLDRLKRADAHVMGIVMNDVELPEYYTSYSLDPTKPETP
jgi:capsular exopolysaccharide synthesis family protein